MRRDPYTLTLLAAAAVAAGCAFVALAFTHGLSVDEIEFTRAADWIARGRLPYRDFWEHHAPLQWYVFAPVQLLMTGSGVARVLAMRLAQLPVWAIALWAMDRFQRDAGMSGRSRLAATAALLTSAAFAMRAIEFRVDALGAMFLALALALGWKRPSAAGICIAAAALANVRFAGAAALIGALALAVDVERGGWRLPPARNLLRLAGGAGLVAVGYAVHLSATSSLPAFVRDVLVDNQVIARMAALYARATLGEVLLGMVAAIDITGFLLLAAAVVGIVSAVPHLRTAKRFEALAIVELAVVLSVVAMPVHYPYHLLLVLLFAAPLLGQLLDLHPRLQTAAAELIALAAVIGAGLMFRASPDRLRYQNAVMQAAAAATSPGERVWDGVGYAVTREPASRYWFLPMGARHLVMAGRGTMFVPRADPPAAIIVDQRMVIALGSSPADLRWVASHYVPTLRHLWLPGLSARLDSRGAAEWETPRDGDYRLIAAPRYAEHIWFENPLLVASMAGPDMRRLTIDAAGASVPPAGALTLTVDGRPVDAGRPLRLRRGARVRLQSNVDRAVGAFLASASAPRLFDAPYRGIGLDEPLFSLR